MTIGVSTQRDRLTCSTVQRLVCQARLGSDRRPATIRARSRKHSPGFHLFSIYIAADSIVYIASTCARGRSSSVCRLCSTERWLSTECVRSRVSSTSGTNGSSSQLRLFFSCSHPNDNLPVPHLYRDLDLLLAEVLSIHIIHQSLLRCRYLMMTGRLLGGDEIIVDDVEGESSETPSETGEEVPADQKGTKRFVSAPDSNFQLARPRCGKGRRGWEGRSSTCLNMALF